MSHPEVSVVIPSHNRPRALERCLDALAAQTLAAGRYEVIVIDDGSAPPLALDVRRWASRFHLEVIRQDNAGPGAARNHGVARARGEFIAFTDDDCLPTADWLDRLVVVLRRQPHALVGGSTFNGLGNDVCAETSQLIVELVYCHFNADPENAYFFASNNMACSKAAFAEVGGFDARFRIASEDRELCDRWRVSGRKLVWEPAARVEHRHSQTMLQFTRLHFRYGQGAFQYQRLRRSRGSGSMVHDLGFHRALATLVIRKLGAYRPFVATRILLCLTLWQVANACGFLWAALMSVGTRKHFTPPRT